MTTVKITELTNIGANLASSTVVPVVNMTAPPVTQKTTIGNIANLVLQGAGVDYAEATVALLAQTVSNAAQPNITSVGTLTSLSVTGNVGLGNVDNVTITGGAANYVLQTDGAGNLSWVAQTGGGNGVPGGNTTEIQFNDAGAFAGNTGFTFNNTTGTLAAPFADVSGVANIVGGGATVAVKSVLNVASTFGSNSSAEPASAQAIRGRVTGSNLSQTRNYVTGVTGQYLVTGTNASEFIKAGILGVVGDQTTTADGAVVAYLDGDGGLTTANAAYAVSMKNSTPNSGFNYGLDLQFIDLNLGGVTTSTFKQADIRFNNGVKLVANTAGNISINGNLMTSAEVVASGVIQSGTGLTTGGYLSVDGNTDLHNTVVTGNLSATGNITATNLGNISAINLTGSNANVLYGNGVFAAVAGGANTGNVTFDDNIVIGTGDEFGDGGLYLAPSPGSVANSAVQYLRVRGGDAPTHIHLDTGNNQYYDQYFGDDAKYVKLELGEAGNIVVGTDDANGNLYSWSFTSDGNLILAGGNSVIQSIANSSLDTLNPNVSTMVLTPDPGYGSQALVLDPTTTGHIHLRAPGANIDEPSANIFLGGEDSSFEVGYYNGAAPNLFIHSNNNTWTFGTDGNLTLPSGGDILVDNGKIISADGEDFIIIVQDSNDDGNRLDLVVTDGTDQATRVEVDIDGMQIHTNLLDVGNSHYWGFKSDGNLNLPGNLVIAGNTSVFGTDAALIQTTDNRPLIALSSGANGAVSSLWVEDIGNVGTSNIAAVYANPTSGSKIVRIAVGQNGGGGPNLWDFGATGNLTLPTSGHIIVSGGLVSSGASPAPTINGFSITNSVGISGNGNIAGNNISATGNISANNFTGNGGTLSNVATKVEGSWTLASGTNTVSINVPLNGTYTIWINGNIPNGIVTYTATGVVTNTNVPVLGEQYAWYYAVGNALVFTTIPDQFVGTVGSISNVNTYAGNTANVFTFGITNNSGNTAVVNYGYTKL